MNYVEKFLFFMFYNMFFCSGLSIESRFVKHNADPALKFVLKEEDEDDKIISELIHRKPISSPLGPSPVSLTKKSQTSILVAPDADEELTVELGDETVLKPALTEEQSILSQYNILMKLMDEPIPKRGTLPALPSRLKPLPSISPKYSRPSGLVHPDEARLDLIRRSRLDGDLTLEDVFDEEDRENERRRRRRHRHHRRHDSRHRSRHSHHRRRKQEREAPPSSDGDDMGFRDEEREQRRQRRRRRRHRHRSRSRSRSTSREREQIDDDNEYDDVDGRRYIANASPSLAPRPAATLEVDEDDEQVQTGLPSGLDGGDSMQLSLISLSRDKRFVLDGPSIDEAGEMEQSDHENVGDSHSNNGHNPPYGTSVISTVSGDPVTEGGIREGVAAIERSTGSGGGGRIISKQHY